MTTAAATAAETIVDESVTATMENFLISEVEIGKRHRKDFGDVEGLADSIRSQGLLQPIGVNQDYELVFGERRLRACRDILKWETIPVRFVNVTSILDGEVDENAMRKNHTVSELVAIVESIRNYQHGGDRRSDQALTSDVESLTIDQAAKKVGLGNKDTFYRAKKVIESGVAELIERMDEGNIAVAVAAEIATESPEQQRSFLADSTTPLTLKTVKGRKLKAPKDKWEDEVAKVEMEAGDSGTIESEPSSSYTVTITTFDELDAETVTRDLSNWEPTTKPVHGSTSTTILSIKCLRDDIKTLLTKLGTVIVKCGQIRLVVE